MVVDQIMGYISIRVEKHCRRRRQCFFQAFSPLPTMFSKAFFLNSFTWHANLRLFKFSRKYIYDFKNMNELGYNYCGKGRNCLLWAISHSHNVCSLMWGMVSISHSKWRFSGQCFLNLFSSSSSSHFLTLAGQLSCYLFRIKVMASKLVCQYKDDMTDKVLAEKKVTQQTMKQVENWSCWSIPISLSIARSISLLKNTVEKWEISSTE